MNHKTYSEMFLSYSNDKFFYMHMTAIAFAVTEVKGTGTGVLWASIFLFAMACMIYGLFKTISYNGKIEKLQKELEKNRLWRENAREDEPKVSFGQFLKRFPMTQPMYAQSVVGILIFSYYLYATESIVLSNVLGWSIFGFFVLLSAFILMLRSSLPYAPQSSKRLMFFKHNHAVNFIVLVLYAIGQVPIMAIVVHIFYRIMFNPEIELGDSFFTHDYQLYLMFYFIVLNMYVFERLRYQKVLKRLSEDENKSEEIED